MKTPPLRRAPLLALAGAASACFVACGTEAQAASLASEYGEPTLLGAGCESVRVALPPPGAPLSIAFEDKAALSVAGATGRGFAQSACTVSLPVFVPEGFRMKISAGAWRGKARIASAAGTSGSLTVRAWQDEAPTSEASGLTLPEGAEPVADPTGALNLAWTLPVNVSEDWSECGRATRLSIQFRAVLRGDVAKTNPDEVQTLNPDAIVLPPLLYKRCAGGAK